MQGIAYYSSALIIAHASQDSSVGTSTRYGMGGRGNPAGSEIFRTHPDQPRGTMQC